MQQERIIEGLHPLERKVLPVLKKFNSLQDIAKESKLQEVEAMRALQWLENKNIIKIHSQIKEAVQLDENGLKYAKEGLPEKRFLHALKNKKLSLEEAKKKIRLDADEFNVCLGVLKGKAAINIESGVISITNNGERLLEKESFEEELLNKLSKNEIEAANLKPEEKFALENLKKRKRIVKISLLKLKTVELTDIGKKLVKAEITETGIVDALTPTMLKNNSWEGKNFRRYDVRINVPKIYGGKRHFVKQATSYAKKIWMDMGFKEMEGPLVNTSFWNFDALFTAQDHPVRDMQDTFFIKTPEKGILPDKKLVERVRKAHETGIDGSTGWQYVWNPEEARKNVLRTHTTVLSAKTIAAIKKAELPAKFFAVGRCFRNEAVDWCHLFEFNQTEGIVVDPDANFRHLLGYLKEFFKRMGYPQARFRPGHFPYTEPSLEIDVFHPVHNKWVELGGAGIFRPEVVEPLLGEPIPVLAWGPGFDRIMMEYYKITDMRDLYKNDLKQLRAVKMWMR